MIKNNGVKVFKIESNCPKGKYHQKSGKYIAQPEKTLYGTAVKPNRHHIKKKE